MVKIDQALPSGPTLERGAPAARPQGAAGAAGEPNALRPGLIVRVELIKALGPEEGLLRIAGRMYRAVYPEGLKPGVPMQLKVTDAGPPLVLQLPDAFSRIFGKLVHPSATSFPAAAKGLLETALPEGAAGTAAGTGAGAELTDLLARLQTLLRLPQDPRELAQALARFVRQSGLFHEADLAAGRTPDDLKTIAQRLLTLVTASGGDERLERLLDSILSHVDTYQARSLLQQSVVVPFALPWPGSEEPVHGELEYGDVPASQDEKQAGGVTLRLDMPNLGHVEAALWWGPTGTSVTLRVEPGLEDWMEERVSGLERSLAVDAGVRVAGVRVETHEPAGPAWTRGLLEVTV